MVLSRRQPKEDFISTVRKFRDNSPRVHNSRINPIRNKFHNKNFGDSRSDLFDFSDSEIEVRRKSKKKTDKKDKRGATPTKLAYKKVKYEKTNDVWDKQMLKRKYSSKYRMNTSSDDEIYILSPEKHNKKPPTKRRPSVGITKRPIRSPLKEKSGNIIRSPSPAKSPAKNFKSVVSRFKKPQVPTFNDLSSDSSDGGFRYYAEKYTKPINRAAVNERKESPMYNNVSKKLHISDSDSDDEIIRLHMAHVKKQNMEKRSRIYLNNSESSDDDVTLRLSPTSKPTSYKSILKRPNYNFQRKDNDKTEEFLQKYSEKKGNMSRLTEKDTEMRKNVSVIKSKFERSSDFDSDDIPIVPKERKVKLQSFIKKFASDSDDEYIRVKERKPVVPASVKRAVLTISNPNTLNRPIFTSSTLNGDDDCSLSIDDSLEEIIHRNNRIVNSGPKVARASEATRILEEMKDYSNDEDDELIRKVSEHLSRSKMSYSILDSDDSDDDKKLKHAKKKKPKNNGEKEKRFYVHDGNNNKVKLVPVASVHSSASNICLQLSIKKNQIEMESEPSDFLDSPYVERSDIESHGTFSSRIIDDKTSKRSIGENNSRCSIPTDTKISESPAKPNTIEHTSLNLDSSNSLDQTNSPVQNDHTRRVEDIIKRFNVSISSDDDVDVSISIPKPNTEEWKEWVRKQVADSSDDIGDELNQKTAKATSLNIGSNQYLPKEEEPITPKKQITTNPSLLVISNDLKQQDRELDDDIIDCNADSEDENDDLDTAMEKTTSGALTGSMLDPRSPTSTTSTLPSSTNEFPKPNIDGFTTEKANDVKDEIKYDSISFNSDSLPLNSDEKRELINKDFSVIDD